MDPILSCHKRAASHPGLLSSSPILSRPFLLPLSSAEDSLIVKCTHHPTPISPSQGLLPAEPVTAEEFTAFSYHVGVLVHSGEAFVGSRALAMYAFAVILKLRHTSESLLKQTTGPRPRLSVSVRWSLRMCSSNKFPGDADVPSPLLPLRSCLNSLLSSLSIYLWTQTTLTVGPKCPYIFQITLP